MNSQKKAYTPPELKTWGTVSDLTQNGGTFSGTDGKGGSGPGRGV